LELVINAEPLGAMQRKSNGRVSMKSSFLYFSHVLALHTVLLKIVKAKTMAL